MLRDQLDYCFFYMLGRAPRAWKPIPRGGLTAVDEQALAALIGAGYVEVQLHRLVRMAGADGSVESALTYTGELGHIEAANRLAEAAFLRMPSWSIAHGPIYWASSRPDEWRLTARGSEAREDQDAGRGWHPEYYALKTGCYRDRAAYDGHGSAEVELTRVSNDEPIAARVVNWSDSRDVLMDCFREALASHGKIGPLDETRSIPILAVDVETLTATIRGGPPVPLDTELHARWCKAHADRPGQWLGKQELEIADEQLIGVRGDRIVQKLPLAISDLFESKPGTGYRLTVA